MTDLVKVEKDDIESTKKLLGSLHDLSVFIARAVKEGWKSAYIFEIIRLSSEIAAVAAEEARRVGGGEEEPRRRKEDFLLLFV